MHSTVSQTRADVVEVGVPMAILDDLSLPLPAAELPRDDAPDVGSRVGHYLIEQRIGEGGMGIVYRAFDPEVGRSVALKFARARRGTIDAKVWSRLRREAQALGRIRHPGVVGLYELGHGAKGAFLALELVEGVHLRRWLHERPRSVHEIVAVIERTATALIAVHRANLLHRDIKPSNILVDTQANVVLVDFGLALGFAELETLSSKSNSAEHTCRTRLTRSNMVVGTTLYMSPEQLFGRDLDVRSDVFSLAVTAYEALYGQRPFLATTAYALAVAFEAGERPSPPAGQVPRAIRAALLDALEIDPAKRTPSVAEFLCALRPEHGRTPGLIAALATSALLGAGTAGALLWPSEPGFEPAAETTEAATTPASPGPRRQ